MDNTEKFDSSRQERLNRIIADYLETQRAGRRVERSELLDRYPDLASELRAFFADNDRMKALAEPPRGEEIASVQPGEETTTFPSRVTVPQDGAADQATLPPSPGGLAEVSTLPPTEAMAASDGSAKEPDSSARRFGDYELLEEIARGGMGVVYKARQVSLNRIVALKMILAGQLAGEEDVRRFYAEAEAAAHLDHPGIVPIFEVDEHEGQHYFSMGYVEGQSLAARVADGPLPVREAVRLAKKVAEAVAYANEQGVIHRDLKPANVLLDKDGQPRVTDFGLAKRVESESGLTATGQILGTPSYMPPEQAAGNTDRIGPASDVYSIGAILYELLTGRPPFRADSPLDTLMQVLDNEPRPVRLQNPGVPRDVEIICLKCLQKDPLLRYAATQELADDLGRFLEGDLIQASSVNLLNRATRALAQSRHEEHFQNWGVALICFGVVIFLAHAAMYVLNEAGCTPLVACWLPRGAMFATLFGLLLRFRPQSIFPTGSVERPIWAVWIGYLISLGALSVVIYVRDQSDTDLYVFGILLSGMAFFVSASHTWGGGYVIGLGFLAAAPLLALFPESSVLWFGSLWGLALFAFGAHYRRLSRRNRGPSRQIESESDS